MQQDIHHLLQMSVSANASRARYQGWTQQAPPQVVLTSLQGMPLHSGYLLLTSHSCLHTSHLCNMQLHHQPCQPPYHSPLWHCHTRTTGRDWHAMTWIMHLGCRLCSINQPNQQPPAVYKCPLLVEGPVRRLLSPSSPSSSRTYPSLKRATRSSSGQIR